MSKLIVACTILCTLLCAVNAEENATIVKEIELSKPFSRTIVDGSRLLTLSANRTHALVNSTDDPTKPCVLALDRVENPIQKNVKAAMLGDKIVVWGVRAQYKLRRTTMDYTVLIVDPKQCTYKPVKTYEEEAIYFDVNKNLPEVVTHGDSFDLIYSSVRGCTPCRYSVDGKRLDLKQTIEPETLEPTTFTHLSAFDGPELKNGYLYAHSYNDRTSKLKLLDHDFKVVKEKTFQHPTDAAAVSSGDKPTITTCYLTSARSFPAKDSNVNCERFDAKLDSVFSIDLPLLEKHDPASVSLDVDVSGDSFVSVVESAMFEEVDVFRLYRLDPTGKVAKVIRLQDMPRNRYYGNYKLRGFVFNKQYCFEITKSWSPWAYPEEADEKESIKCIAI